MKRGSCLSWVKLKIWASGCVHPCLTYETLTEEDATKTGNDNNNIKK